MAPVLWAAIAIVMAVLEVAFTSLITVWFVVGALVSLVASIMGLSEGVQLALFLGVSLLLLVALRPLALKHRNNGPSAEPTLVGSEGVVCEAIDGAPATGRVEMANHMTWAARSADGRAIEVGARVSVVGQESVKLVVERKQP